MIDTPHARDCRNALEILGHLAALEWRPLTGQERSGFCDATLIADVSDSRTARLAEILDIRPAHGLVAVIGGIGDSDRQVELHGCEADGEPIAVSLPLQFQIGY